MVEREPSKCQRMRLDRDNLAIGPHLSRHHQSEGADIGADIDEGAARWGVLAQEVELVEIVVGIEQRATLGGAALVVEPERGALVLHVDRAAAQQVDQPRHPRPERPALQPRLLRQANDRGLRRIRRKRAERRG